jgi:tetratricopeptide (TPR) repeat protein
MMQISQVGSDGELAQRALAHCLKIDDSDYFVLQRWQWMVQPKWGGSIEALRQTDAYVGARVDKIPLLGVQLGSVPLYEAYMLANDDEWAQALPKLESAVTLAPEAYYLRWTGNAARNTGDQWKALAYLTQSLRFAPNDEETRQLRSVTRILLGDYTGAIADAEVALKKEPANGLFALRLAESHAFLHHTEAARAAFRIARDDPATHKYGFERWCESFFFAKSDLPQAVACTADLVKEFPQGGQAWYLRLRALDQTNGKQVSAAANEFLKYADMSNAQHKRIVDQIRVDPVKWGVKL